MSRALLYSLYAFIAFITFDHVEDDAFIYFRVGQHLANGHGYVFNAGGERIEVGSSIAWQALVALAQVLRLDVLLFTKAVSLGLGAATLWLLSSLSRALIQSAILQGVPALLLAVTVPFYGWVQRGLETSLYLFSILLLAHCITSERHRERWPWAALLVCLSRSEGPLVLLGLSAFLVLDRGERRRNLRGLLFVVATLGGIEVARLVYFRDLVPHPFYLKIQEPPGVALGVVTLYFRETYTWLLVAGGVVGLALRSTWDRRLVVLAVLNVPLLAWAVRTFALVEYNRHLAPALPLLYLLCVRGMDALASRSVRLEKPLAVGVYAFSGWLLLGAPAMSLSLHRTENLFMADLRRALQPDGDHVERLLHLLRGAPHRNDPKRYATDGIAESWAFHLGTFIRWKYPPGTTVAFDQMGQTPWYAGPKIDFIDTWGLTYRATAFPIYNALAESHPGGHIGAYRRASQYVLDPLSPVPYRSWTRNDAVDHLFRLQPHVIILSEFTISRTLPDGTVEPNLTDVPGLIAADPRLDELYVMRRKWMLRVYERKDLAARMTWPIADKVPGIPPGSVSAQPESRARP